MLSKMRPSSSRPLSRPAVRIALVMIVRNEAESIARCLLSAQGAVDEMIVLDTGSTDATISIARDLGAKVFEWAWRDDFAAARNMALSHATADWCLVLDADEWLLCDGQLLRQAVDAASSDSFLGLLPIHSEVQALAHVDAGADDSAGVPTRTPAEPAAQSIVSWIPRLLPRGVRYAGRIHEQPVSDLPRRQLQVRIGHDGYLWRKVSQKKGRNRALLLKSIADEPGSAYLQYQLGKDYDIYGDDVLALACYEKALQRVASNQGYRTDLVVRTLVCLKRSGLHELAYRFAEDEMENCRHSPDFFYVLADLLVDYADRQPVRGFAELLPLARISLLFCLEIGDTPGLVGAVHGRGSHLARQSLGQLDRLLSRPAGPAVL